LEACTQFNLEKKIDSMAETVFSKEMVYEYKDVFEGLGCMPLEYHIEVQQNATQVVHPPRKVPRSLSGKLKKYLEILEKKSLCQVDKPTAWVNSLVIADKKDGILCLCLDPRDLNKVIKCEHYKIPHS